MSSQLKRCSVRGCTVRAWLPCRCQGRSQCNVDGQLGSLLDGQTHGKDFDCPLVPRLHGNVHVPKFHNLGERWLQLHLANAVNALIFKTTCARCSVTSHSVERGTTLTLSISDVKRRRNLSKISVRKSPGWTSNSWWVGEPWNTSPAPGPANEPCQRPTSGQTSRSPGGGTRKKKARDVASRVATLLAPLKQQRVGGLHIANLPN